MVILFRYLLILAFCLTGIVHSYAQRTPVKNDGGMSPQVISNSGVSSDKNFATFTPERQIQMSEALLTQTPPEFQQHPEFGKFVYRQVLDQYVELVHKRTEDSRYFIDPKDKAKFLIQRSYGAMHYKNAQGWWCSIDPRLTPSKNQAGLFTAMNQPHPVKVDLINGYTSIEIENIGEVKSNRNVEVYILSPQGNVNLGVINASMKNSTIGNEGVKSLNVLGSIDREIIVNRGEIKTNFILNKRLPELNDLPKGVQSFLAFEETIELPFGTALIHDSYKGSTNSSGFWAGDLILVNGSGEEVIRWQQPLIYDNLNSTKGLYFIRQTGNKVKLTFLVDAEWLSNKERIFPIVIDPLEKSRTSRVGEMGFRNNPSCTFTNKDYCKEEDPKGYKLDLNMPKRSVITEILFLITAQYSNPPSKMNRMFFSFENQCARSPSDPAFYWSCPTGANTKGTCSTNQSGVENPYVLEGGGSCIDPSCDDRTIPFYFQGLGCDCTGGVGDCPKTCQWVKDGDWIMLAEGRTIEPAVKHVAGSAKYFTVCQGESVSFEANAAYGVKPYSYEWLFPDGSTSTDSKITYQATIIGDYEFILKYQDACNAPNKPDTFKIKVKQSNEVTLNNKKDVSCFGGNDGSIELEVKDNVIRECGASPAGCAFAQAKVVDFNNNTAMRDINGRSPFQGGKTDFKVGFLYTATELKAAGLEEGKMSYLEITLKKTTTKPFKQFTIKMACTPLTRLTKEKFDMQGLIPVYGPKNFETIDGTNRFDFDNGFVWDGVQNLYVEFCYDNDFVIGGLDAVEGHSISKGFLANWGESLKDAVSGCSVYNNDNVNSKVATGLTSSERLNFTFGYCGGFLWSTGESTKKIENLKAGEYTVTYVDPIGCSFIQPYTITEPPKLEATVDPCPDASGNITITATGGEPDYEYSYNGTNYLGGVGANIYPISSLAAGSYTFKVRDENGCLVDVPFEIKDPILIDTIVKQPCFIDGKNGEIEVTPKGGKGPYEISVQLKGSNPVYEKNKTKFTLLRSGTYIVSVKGSEGCPAGLEVILNVPKEIKIDKVDLKDPCFGKNDGSIEITASGGIAGGYEYSINSGTTFQASNRFENLGAKSYTIVVKDKNGCLSSVKVETLKQPASALLFDANPVIVQPSCTGKKDGRIDFKVSTGGVPPYEYSIDGSAFTTDLFFDQLEEKADPKEYTLTVKDKNGCTDEKKVLIQAPPSVKFDEALSIFKVEIKCFGDPTAEFVLVGIDGNPPYTYELTKDGNPVAPEAGKPNEFKALKPGNYVAKIIDSKGCETIPFSKTITEPDELKLDAQITKPNKCNNDAEITSVVTGGTTPYTYTFDGVVSATFIHGNLTPKKYQIKVVDNNGCEKLAEIEILALPALDITSADVSKRPTCFESKDGEVTVTANGGEAPLEYSINGVAYQPGNIVTGYGEGLQKVFVRDAKGCIQEKEVTVTAPAKVTLKSGDKRTICIPKTGSTLSVDLGDAADLPATGFTWESQRPNIITNATKGTFNTTGLAWGNYIVYHIVETCTTEVTVTLAGVEVDQYVNLCDNQDKVVFDAPKPGGGSWTTPSSDFVIDNITNEITVKNPKVGEYKMVYLLGNGCTETMLLKIHPTPVADFNLTPYPGGSNFFYAEIDKVTFTDKSTTGPNSFYIWRFGDGDTAVGTKAEHIFKKEGEFNVTLEVISEDTCKHQITKPVSVKRLVEFVVSNFVTPNEDGKNDVLEIPQILDYNLEMWIHDRWGVSVFRYPDDGNKWNPNSPKNVSDGVYFYVAKLTNKVNGKELIKKGNITIMR